MHRDSAIARFKAARRKIRRDRKLGVTPAYRADVPPVYAARQSPTGEWFVHRRSLDGARLSATPLAGPFDSRDEAEGWTRDQ